MLSTFYVGFNLIKMYFFSLRINYHYINITQRFIHKIQIGYVKFGLPKQICITIAYIIRRFLQNKHFYLYYGILMNHKKKETIILLIKVI